MRFIERTKSGIIYLCISVCVILCIVVSIGICYANVHVCSFMAV
jgi:hypothetical protein